jgi:hypothetical protein
MNRFGAAVVLAAALLFGSPTPARADITAFLGATTTPANRMTTGIAVGAGLVIVAFEFEYASTPDDASAGAPSLKTGMGNALLQTPVAFFGFQPYVTAGGGIYSESLNAHADTSFGTNIGGGVKMSLVGPVRLRIDYRLFNLGSGALYSPVHRVYVGVNLKLF